MDTYEDKRTKTPNIGHEVPQKNQRIYRKGDRIRNVTIWIELNVESLEEKVQRHKRNWEEHLSRIVENCILRIIY